MTRGKPFANAAYPDPLLTPEGLAAAAKYVGLVMRTPPRWRKYIPEFRDTRDDYEQCLKDRLQAEGIMDSWLRSSSSESSSGTPGGRTLDSLVDTPPTPSPTQSASALESLSQSSSKRTYPANAREHGTLTDDYGRNRQDE